MEQFRIQMPSESSRRSASALVVFLAALTVVSSFLKAAVAVPGLLVGVLALAYLVWAMRRAMCVLTPKTLAVQGDFFRQHILRSSLLTAEARVVSLKNDWPLQPQLRTFGTAWPGYLSGWFRLRNKRKAWILVTDWSRVVYLPTTQGYVLLLSVEQPDEFLRVLREGA